MNTTQINLKTYQTQNFCTKIKQNPTYLTSPKKIRNVNSSMWMMMVENNLKNN